MLIDSSHPEETRVVVLDGQKVEEFDFEAASKRPLKGNIYLAKVTRVEPSLQAAFVEYGGNRQGFLAFSEIHPDYYQIPVADRMALLAEQEAEARRRDEEEFELVETAFAPAPHASVAEVAQSEEHLESDVQFGFDADSSDGRHAADAESDNPGSRSDHVEHERHADSEIDSESAHASGEQHERAIHDEPGMPESSGADEEFAGASGHNENPPVANEARAAQSARPAQRWTRKRHYKIQEVIKRRQIILVQVVKEERGTKGAALTTYLSLAGRYCVLMPNTPRGGGISRKITSATDRKRLKAAAQALELPEGMGLIIRTAGENRTKTEIKRDYEYLLRMWDTVRELTLKSNAPACVYEEGDLIKRAIRDLYNKDVAEIVVEGDDGYRNAKDFMRMLMPSHAKNVKQYKEPVPLFQRHHIEAQLDAMFSPTVTLRAGGYIVINQTEALVAIDVNSGRATREHSIEDTAYKTNLEAAEEIARQLRLRDLAGLIVIDFIDMEDGRNDRNVEKRLRDCVKIDRARVQIGKISQFGLLEMSRQRLRAGVVAGSTVSCPHCGGQGIVRSVESTALRVLRSLEEEGQRQRAPTVVVRAQPEVAIYTLNQKRRELNRIETEYDMAIQFEPKDGIVAGTFELDRVGQKSPEERVKIAPLAPVENLAPSIEEDVAEDEEVLEDEDTEVTEQQPARQEGSAQPPDGKRRRRRRRRGRDHASTGTPQRAQASASAGQPRDATETQHMAVEEDTRDSSNPSSALPEESQNGQQQPSDGQPRRKRRRRRRGRRSPQDGTPSSAETQSGIPEGEPVTAAEVTPGAHAGIESEAPHVLPNAPSEPVWSLSHGGSASEARQAFSGSQTGRAAPPPSAEGHLQEPVHAPADETGERNAVEADPAARQEESQQPARKGWWQRPFRSRA
jgi:ribonuclease E